MAALAFAVDRIPIPTAPHAAGWEDFAASVEVRNAVEAAAYGNDELSLTAQEVLPGWLDQEHAPKQLLVALVGGRVVARAVYETLPEASARVAWLSVEVLPEYRRRGIGTALTDAVESIAGSEGRNTLLVYAAAAAAELPGGRMSAPTGYGSLPLADPGVAFLVKRGYRLEQVERGSRLALPADPDLLDSLYSETTARAGDEYRVHLWTDRTPSTWRSDMATLYTRMSTDAPTAGLQEPEDIWTVERLVVNEELHAKSPRTTLVAAAEHVASGRLAGFSELSVPVELTRAVSQEDTLVLREHRGHRLGMLVKLANLRQLADVAPGHPSVMTFNAEENRYMLDVNEALGFVPIGYEGGWKRVVPAS